MRQCVKCVVCRQGKLACVPLVQVAQDAGLQLVVPPPRWCTDNGVMVAWAGIERCAHVCCPHHRHHYHHHPKAAAAADALPIRLTSMSLAVNVLAGRAHHCSFDSIMHGPALYDVSIARRLGLGLVDAPLPPLPEDGSAEWIELRPRWPLTSEKHPRSMPPTLSMKKPDKQARSLTDLTRAELGAMARACSEQALPQTPSLSDA
jgi:hypothetical protein